MMRRFANVVLALLFGTVTFSPVVTVAAATQTHLVAQATVQPNGVCGPDWPDPL